MSTAVNQPPLQNTKLIFTLGVFISLIISWLYISNSHVITSDSLLYIFTAQTFLDHGIQAATEVYQWPFFAIIIAGVHSLTGLSLQLAGHLFIAATYAGLTCVFISLTKDLGGSTRTQLLALLVISILPTLNDYRDYITRDPGFWLFILLSLQQLLRFALKHHLKHAIAWFLFTLIAITFRTEAVFFAVFAPFALFTNRDIAMGIRLKGFGILYGLFAGLALIFLALILASPQLSEKLRLVAEITTLPDFFKSIAIEFKQNVEAFSQLAPHKFSANDMGAIIGTGLIGLVLYTLLHALTLPYIILLGWNWKQALFSSPKYKHYLFIFLLIALSYLLLLSFKKYFMTDRFCILAVLVILLTLAFRIEKLWSHPGKFFWRRISIIFLLLIPALDSMISSGSSKEYIAQATKWVEQNKTPQQKLLTNHKQIAVLGANCLHQCLIASDINNIKYAISRKPELLAIRIKHKETSKFNPIESLLQDENWEPLKTFSNEKNDKVVIFSFKPEGSHTKP